MREDDPTQQMVDRAVLEKAEEMARKVREETAVLFNNAIVSAFSGKG